MSVMLGDRLREVRKRRGLTQSELAREAGVSLSLVRKLEQGEREGARMETVRRLAAALRVPTMRLVTEAGEDGASATTLDLWAPVRAALTAPVPAGSDLDDEPVTVAGVSSAVDAAVALFSGDRFAEIAAVLPPLLRDADAVAELGADGRAVRVRLLQLAGWLMVQTRQFDSASWALESSLSASTDHVQASATVNTQCWLLLRQGQLGQARELATRWADETEPRMSRATPDELSGWGWLLLRISAAAVRDNRSDEAADALRLAHAAGVALGREFAPPGDFLRTFGPVTVMLKRAENAAVLDRPDQVLDLAGRIPTGGLRPTSNNRNRHLLDVAAARASMRDYNGAVETLTGVWHAAPQWLPNQRFARDIVSRVVEHRRTLTPETRTLADAVGLPL